MPRPGQVLGLVGTNGIGKSTALKILSGKLKPNLGRYDNPPDWEEILKYFRGSELQSLCIRPLDTILGLYSGRLFHKSSRRRSQGCGKASVCRPDPESRQRSGSECGDLTHSTIANEKLGGDQTGFRWVSYRVSVLIVINTTARVGASTRPRHQSIVRR